MKILIAIDSKSFVKSIGDFLKHCTANRPAEVYVLKVLEPLKTGSYLSVLPSPVLEELLKDRLLECAATVREMSLYLRDALHVQDIHEFTIEGVSVAGVINQFAREHKIDLIVVGTHHRRGFSRMLEGSVSSSVIAHAPCSVLIVDRPSIEAEGKNDAAIAKCQSIR